MKHIHHTLKAILMKNRQITVPLRRHQLDQQLIPLQPFARTPGPRKGWVREIRDALGMTSRQLAQRLRIAQPTVAKLERSEAAETISLKSLRKLAEALDCTLVYALVPNESLEATLNRQAQERAAQRSGRVEHTMRLEAQGRSQTDLERERQQLAEELLRTLSRDLWEMGE